MVHRQNIQSKKRLPAKKVSHRTKKIKKQQLISTAITKQTPSDNLDDETKLAKRHLTKEMWQLVSIAVKRMADELVAISNNQQPTITSNNHPTILDIPTQSSETSAIEQSIITNTGAGDEPFVKENLTVVKESSTKRRSSPLQMLESSVNIKRKGSSNNATSRSMISKIKNKSSKKIKKTTTQCK